MGTNGSQNQKKTVAGCNVLATEVNEIGNIIKNNGLEVSMSESISAITVRKGFVVIDKDENGKEIAYYCIDGKKVPIDLEDAKKSRENQINLGNVVKVSSIEEGIRELENKNSEVVNRGKRLKGVSQLGGATNTRGKNSEDRGE